jgi:hypothetical protein
MLILTLLVEDMFCLFYFLMFVVFMYGLCLQVSDWIFFLFGSVNWGGLYMAVLHQPDGKWCRL